MYRFIDFYNLILNLEGVILYNDIYDPNRSCYISLVLYKNGYLSYILSIKNLNVGVKIFNGLKNNYGLGSSLNLKYSPKGIFINNIEKYPGSGSKFCRAAGTLVK